MTPPTRHYYGWIIVFVTIPVLMVTAGIRAVPGAWLVPMRDELGWSTASLSFAAALGLVVYGLGGPVPLCQNEGCRSSPIAS